MTEATVRLERYLGNPSPEREMPPRVGEHGERLERSVQTIYEWFEWGFRPPPHTNRQREQDVMRRLPERGIVLILGVPGAGKSTLARQWFDRFQTDEPARPAMIGECGLLGALEEKENMLHAILGLGRNGKARDLLAGSIPPRTVLIVDALDELPTRFDKTKLTSAIHEASEHALVVLTCRTHVWGDTLEAVFKREQIRIDQTFTLLGFTPLEQREYLTRWAEQAGKPKQDAENLAKNLEKHPQLRSLAANALLLELIARVALEDGVMLPASRAEFYERAIDNLWKHAELKGMIAKRNDLWRLRDRFLRALGLCTKRDDGIEARIGADEINEAMRLAAVPENLQDDLYDYLEKIGLLVKIGDPTSSELRFVHLTFHEFALAQGLMLGADTKLPNAEEIMQKLENLLLKDWTVTAFEPTLALAVSIAHGKKADLLQPFSSLVNSWRQGQPSALMAALHLYNNAAVDSESVTNMLVERIQGISLGPLKVAGDAEAHPVVLERFSDSNKLNVLIDLAGNPSLPTSLLEKFVNGDPYMFFSLASNPSSSQRIFDKLEKIDEQIVKWGLACNPSTPVRILERLVLEKDSLIQGGLAENPNAPLNVIEKLVEGQDLIVLIRLLKNPNTPIEMIARLEKRTAIADDPDVPWRVASNPKSDLHELETLSDSTDLNVLQRIASNPSSPKNLLDKLAASSDEFVLQNLANNPNCSQDTLEQLAKKSDLILLENIAGNSNSSPKTLEYLFEKGKELAENQQTTFSSSPERNEFGILERLAENPKSPQHILEKLAKIENSLVIWKLVRNPSFVLEWLAPPSQIPDSQSLQENTNPLLERNSMTWSKELTELRNVLMALYPSVQDARRLVQEAGMNQARVNLNGEAINFWQSILGEANKQQVVQEVIDVARKEFPKNRVLEEAALEWQKHNGVPNQETPNSTRALYRKPEDTSNARGGFISLEKPRWNPVNATPDGVIPVLFLPSDPADQNHLKLLREMGKIGQQLRGAKHRDRFKLEPQALVTPEEVAQGLRDFRPEIVHFAGHGSRDGRLAWLDETGNSLSVPVEALGNMIGSRREHKVQCVVLNACYTISEAKTLLKQVPYVIATKQAIDDDAAIAFATGLYQALAGGDDLGEAFNAGLALIQAQLSDLREHEKFVLLERE